MWALCRLGCIEAEGTGRTRVERTRRFVQLACSGFMPSSPAKPPDPHTQAPESNAAPATPAPGAETCITCGATGTSPYCGACGAQRHPPRITASFLWQRFRTQALDLEHGLLRTAWALTRDPGGTVKRYVNGDRARWTGPIPYFLVTATLCVLVITLFQDPLAAQIQDSFGSYLSEPSETEGGERLFSVADMMAWIQTYYAYIMLGQGLVLVGLLHPLEGRGRYTATESFVFMLYTFGHWNVYATLLTPLIAYLGYTVATAIILLSGLLVVVYGAVHFYGRGARSAVLGGLAFLASYLLFAVGSGLVGAVVALFLNA